MEFCGKLLQILDAKMTVPEMYGWFHIIFFIVSILGGVLLYKFFGDKKHVKKVLLISSLVVILLEVYKQINFTFSYDGNIISADYQWYAFPFQFCSTPMYIGLLAALIGHKKLHNSLCAYLATYALFAGFSVMFYPATVFIETIGINLQTMICHGSMITIGIYLLATGYVKARHKTILQAMPIFAVCVVLAVIMNEIAYFTGLLQTDTFNMYFISQYCDPSLPVYSLVQAVVPYPLCLIIYIIGFTAAAYIILLISMAIKYFINKHKSKTNFDFSVEQLVNK